MFKEEKHSFADDEHTQSRSLGEQAASSLKGQRKEYKLRQVCTLINGRAYSKSELLDEGTYPVLRVGNFFTNNHWYYSDMDLAPDKYCDDGDLLYAWSASFGPRIWAGVKVIFHYHIWKVMPNAQLIDKKFLFFWFLWDADHIRADQGTGTTMMHVAKGSMEDRDILLPSLSEQERIVAILDVAFEELDRVRDNCAQTLQMARSFLNGELNYLFSRGRTGWTQTTVGSQLTLQRGFDITKDQQTEGMVPVVSSGGIRSFHNRSMCSSPGVVIGRKGTLGKVFYVDIDYWPHDTTLWTKDFKGNNPKLVYYLFRGLDVKQFDSGTANPALNRNQVHPIKIWWPPPNEQTFLVSQLDEMVYKVEHLESIYSQKLRALASLKQSLLHQAFSGKL